MDKVSFVYANALSKAVDVKELEAIEKEFNTFIELFQNPEIKNIYMNPSITIEEKRTSLSVFEFSTKFSNFLRVLIDKKRMDYLSAIRSRFSEIVDERLNRQTLRIRSARELTQSELEEALTKAKSYFSASTISYTTEIDETLIGGYILQTEHEVLDVSYSGKLRTLTESLLTSKEM